MLTACTGAAGEPDAQPLATMTSDPTPAPETTAAASAPATPTEPPVIVLGTQTPEARPRPEPGTRRPRWLGTRVLPRRDDGFGVAQPTPRVLRNRRFPTIDLLPPPQRRRFSATVTRVPDDVLARSTWRPDCPVTPDELRYLTMTFWGFDDQPHTGEMIINASVADDVVEVFRRLYRARFPIEEMRVRRAGEIDAPPTGDYNNTDGFDCRAATGGSSWSNHAYGLAIDINPFHNPYRKGDLIVPELAESYLDRSWERPGMILRGDVVVRAFTDIGWGWAGDWATTVDWQHFSHNGR